MKINARFVLIFFLLLLPGFRIIAQSEAHIYFKFNSFTISDADKNRIAGFVSALPKTQSSCKIRISGYCDSVGNHAYNDQLSLMRANVIKNELIFHGISSSKIEYLKGWGKRKPVNANKTETQRQANRRVDITLIYPNNQDNNKPDNNLQTLNSDDVKTGARVVLKNLNFYGGLHRLLPQSLPTLDTLVHILVQHPNLKICIQGYVCCTLNGEDGEDFETHTNDLSWHRAKEIYEYLINHKIDRTRLSYIGMGGKYHLVDPEITEENKITNRRVEIVVTEQSTSALKLTK